MKISTSIATMLDPNGSQNIPQMGSLLSP